MSNIEENGKRSTVAQMLDDLELHLGHFPGTADVLMEFADRANRGDEAVDRNELVDEYVARVRKTLGDNLGRSEFLTALGRTYRKDRES